MDTSQPHRAPHQGPDGSDADEPGSSPPSDEPLQPPPNPTNKSLREHDAARAQRVEIADAFALISDDTAAWLEENAQRAMRTAGATGELRIALLRDPEMTQAHERHCNAPGSTDVITFNLSESDDLDVDVFVCVDEAQRQADSRGISIDRELLLYIIHAMLHCTGYNDKAEHDAARMHEREDELLTAIGVGPVYYLPDKRERA